MMKETFNKRLRTGLINQCITILIEGYEMMVKEDKYDIGWDEEQITAQLISYMERTNTYSKKLVDIVPEPRIYDNTITSGKVLPKKAPKVDIRIAIWYSNWLVKEKLIYIFEAKNLSENDWTKKSGAKVRSKAQKKRYISKGINHFISGHYNEGSLIGYIVNGNPKAIVNGINEILEKSNPSREKEKLKNYSLYKHSYKSSHKSNTKSFDLIHFMLKF